MAALDFPNAPTTGQIFAPAGGQSWVWSGTNWLLSAAAAAGSDGFTFTQDTKPTATKHGQTWHNSATGNSFVWVVDATSSQWVQFSPGGGPPAGRELGYGENTVPAGFAPTTTALAVPGLACSVTLASARRLLVETQSLNQHATTAGIAVVQLVSTTAAVDTQIAQQNIGTNAIGQWVNVNLSARRIYPAGTHSFKTYHSTTAGFLQLVSSATIPAYLLVSDLGPS